MQIVIALLPDEWTPENHALLDSGGKFFSCCIYAAFDLCAKIAYNKKEHMRWEKKMSAAHNDFTITVAGYLALEAASPDTRYEYLDGQLTMMTGGSRNHSRIGLDIAAFLIRAIRNSSCEVFNSDARVKLSDARYVYPDVSVSCAVQPEDDFQTVIDPTIIVEVLSPGTIEYDRGKKLQRYRECPSLQAILLVFQDQPLVEVYRRQSEKVWTIQTYGMDELIVLDAIGVTLPVAEIYRRVEFTS